MKVEDVLKVCASNIIIKDDGKTVYAPFGKWDPEWDSREVQWLDANEEGVIIIGI